MLLKEIGMFQITTVVYVFLNL